VAICAFEVDLLSAVVGLCCLCATIEIVLGSLEVYWLSWSFSLAVDAFELWLDTLKYWGNGVSCWSPDCFVGLKWTVLSRWIMDDSVATFGVE